MVRRKSPISKPLFVPSANLGTMSADTGIGILRSGFGDSFVLHFGAVFLGSAICNGTFSVPIFLLPWSMTPRQRL